MSLQLTMINNKETCNPVKSKASHTHLYRGEWTMHYLQLCGLLCRVPISSLRKHRYLFQEPSSTKTHSGITPLISYCSHQRFLVWFAIKKLWNTMQAPWCSITTETHLMSIFWLSALRINPHCTKIHNFKLYTRINLSHRFLILKCKD